MIERKIREDLELAVEIVSRLEGVRRRARVPRVEVDPGLPRDVDAELDEGRGVLRVRPRALENPRTYRRVVLHEAAHLVDPDLTEREAERLAGQIAREIEAGRITVDGDGG